MSEVPALRRRNPLNILVTGGASRTGVTIHIFGNDYEISDGTCIPDYIHVGDIADAHVRALDYLRNEGESCALNLANERGGQRGDRGGRNGRRGQHHVGNRAASSRRSTDLDGRRKPRSRAPQMGSGALQ